VLQTFGGWPESDIARDPRMAKYFTSFSVPTVVFAIPSYGDVQELPVERGWNLDHPLAGRWGSALRAGARRADPAPPETDEQA
jgi:hypothetical protein